MTLDSMDFVVFVEAVLSLALLIGFALSHREVRWAVLDYGVAGLAILAGGFTVLQRDALGLTWSLIPLAILIGAAGLLLGRTVMTTLQAKRGPTDTAGRVREMAHERGVPTRMQSSVASTAIWAEILKVLQSTSPKLISPPSRIRTQPVPAGRLGRAGIAGCTGPSARPRCL